MWWYNYDIYLKVLTFSLFIEGYGKSVAIPMKQVEWKHIALSLMQRQFPLMLSLNITIHKTQGRTLEMAIIDLRNSEKCAGMTWVALSCVKKSKNIKLQYFSYERLKNVNKAEQLPKL